MRSKLRALRVATTALALVANLFATSVPVLHALVHEREARHHEAPAAAGAATFDHGHDPAHADALHDELVLVKRQPLDLFFIALVGGIDAVLVTETRVVSSDPSYALPSRAPPASDLARAPPPA